MDEVTGEEHHCYNPSKHMCIDEALVEKYVLETFIVVDKGHSGYPDDPSGVDFTLTVLDRTPPHILSTSGGAAGVQLPALFADPDGPKATTGDFCEIQEIALQDNSAASISCKIAFNRKFGPIDPEHWVVASEPLQLPKGVVASFVIMPNDCLGDMQYSLFAWDDAGNLNPGAPMVKEDNPAECYGFVDHGFDALATDTDFPLKIGSFSSDLHEFFEERKAPLGKGRIVVDDNDFPNLMIQVVSKRDRLADTYALCFPPPIVDPASRPLTIDSNPDTISRLTLGASYTWDMLQEEGVLPYVQILRAEDRNSPGEPGFLKLQSNDPSFVCRNFRLESPSVSDSFPDARPDRREETFGKRNGFGSRALVYCLEPLVEDSEYEIALWAEDNVKWINDDRYGDRIDPPYTGIKEVELTVSDRTQNPVFRETHTAARTRTFWTPTLRAVFRDPVGPLSPGAGEAEWDAKHPFVEAKVKDYKGNQRSLKVYFSIIEEKSTIRILERQHLKN